MPLLNIALLKFETYEEYSNYNNEVWAVMNWAKANERFQKRNKPTDPLPD